VLYSRVLIGKIWFYNDNNNNNNNNNNNKLMQVITMMVIREHWLAFCFINRKFANR
jgi:hypothetical protein